MWKRLFEKKWIGYALAVFGVAIVSGALKLFGGHINSTTVALVLLLTVLFVATGWGARPAIIASLLGVACFNFFFLPPVGTFTINDAVFRYGSFITAVITFIAIAVAVFFFIVKPMEVMEARRARGEEEPPLSDEERRHQELLAALTALNRS